MDIKQQCCARDWVEWRGWSGTCPIPTTSLLATRSYHSRHCLSFDHLERQHTSQQRRRTFSCCNFRFRDSCIFILRSSRANICSSVYWAPCAAKPTASSNGNKNTTGDVCAAFTICFPARQNPLCFGILQPGDLKGGRSGLVGESTVAHSAPKRREMIL